MTISAFIPGNGGTATVTIASPMALTGAGAYYAGEISGGMLGG
jgi:hypothetical protein